MQHFCVSFTEENHQIGPPAAIEPNFDAESQQWLSVLNFLHLQTGSLELCQSDLWVLRYLTKAF